VTGGQAGAPAQEAILAAVGVTKSFDGIHALRDVTFTANTSMVSVLVGENGAGKSTLMRILCGVEQPDSGTIRYAGSDTTFRSSWDAIRAGIGIIHQEMSLLPNLSIAENIFAGRELRRGRIFTDLPAERRRAAALLRRLGQDLDPDTLVETLPVGQQQLVEIAKALAGDPRVLIMDEPTSALSATETEVLFKVVRDLKANGMTIIYISHRLEELRRIGDSVTVLRNGQVVARRPMAEATTSWIAEQMTGRELGELPARAAGSAQEEILRVTGLSAVPPRGTAVRDVSLLVRSGEIVGIYGLLGAGRTELLECLVGSRALSGGDIAIAGQSCGRLGVASRLRRGLVLVPEDRQRDGLVQTLSVADNILLASLRTVARPVLISDRAAKKSAWAQVDSLRIKIPGMNAPVTALSGGNQQKVLIARALLTSPKVLLLDEPSRGVDVGAKGEIFRIIRELSDQGMGILFTSSDLGEVLSVPDRVLVMADGRITAEFSRTEATEGALAQAASARNDSEVTR
jgi:erythritol transport system ATP-binding protein